ncbi:hypothetical protein, partial [Soonwooa sp.]|uniref:hypothetical protein n=1 Tax=Soonwooa sp. TaxID=1938592 RepID=UPI00289FA1FB
HTEYLWLILNSTLLGYLFRYYIYSFDETGFKIFTDYFQNIPLPFPNEKLLKESEKFMRDRPNIDLINKWVYMIYGFSDEEVIEIENSVFKLINESR